MSGTLSTMFAAPSNAITGKRRIEPQQFDGASRRSAVDMAVRPNRWAPSAPNRNAISTTSGFAVSACPTRDGSQMALSNFFSCDAPYPGSVSIWSLFRSQREVATSQQPAHADARCPARKARRPGEPLSPDKPPSPHPLLGEQGVTECRHSSLAVASVTCDRTELLPIFALSLEPRP